MRKDSTKLWMKDTVKLLLNDQAAIDKTYYKQSGKKIQINQEMMQATINGMHDARNGVELPNDKK